MYQKINDSKRNFDSVESSLKFKHTLAFKDK